MILFQAKKFLYRKQLKLRLYASPSLRKEIYLDALQRQADDMNRAIKHNEKQKGLCTILYNSMISHVDVPNDKYIYAREVWKFLPEFSRFRPKSNADFWWWPNSPDSPLRFGILNEMIEMLEE